MLFIQKGTKEDRCWRNSRMRGYFDKNCLPNSKRWSRGCQSFLVPSYRRILSLPVAYKDESAPFIDVLSRRCPERHRSDDVFHPGYAQFHGLIFLTIILHLDCSASRRRNQHAPLGRRIGIRERRLIMQDQTCMLGGWSTIINLFGVYGRNRRHHRLVYYVEI